MNDGTETVPFALSPPVANSILFFSLLVLSTVYLCLHFLARVSSTTKLAQEACGPLGYQQGLPTTPAADQPAARPAQPKQCVGHVYVRGLWEID